MIEHLNAHAHIEHPYRQQRQSLQHVRILGGLPHGIEISSVSGQKCNGDTHDKNENPVAALNNLHEIFRVILCIGNGDLWIEHCLPPFHKTGNRCRHHFCQGQHGHRSISIQNQCA